jgi:hypothetical protein
MSVVVDGFQQRFYELSRDAFMCQEDTSMSAMLSTQSCYSIKQSMLELGISSGARAKQLPMTLSVLIYANGRIRFIQVTAGKERSFKTYAVVGLLRELESRFVHFHPC